MGEPMFDVFVAPLRCPACGAEAPEAEIQTHLRNGSADGSALRIGDELDAADLTSPSLLGTGHALVRSPDLGGPIRLLDMWICSTCDTEQWARIEIVGHEVHRIDAVRLDRPTLMSCHFIGETNAAILADSLREPSDEASDPVEVLRRRLPR